MTTVINSMDMADSVAATLLDFLRGYRFRVSTDVNEPGGDEELLPDEQCPGKRPAVQTNRNWYVLVYTQGRKIVIDPYSDVEFWGDTVTVTSATGTLTFTRLR